MQKQRSPRYIGPKIETRLPKEVVKWYEQQAVDNEMPFAEYTRKVLLAHYDKERNQ
jgi:hypothetical protein